MDDILLDEQRRHHRICFRKGLPESVVEFCGQVLDAYPDLVPEGLVIVEWEHEPAAGVLSFSSQPDVGPDGPLLRLEIGAGWWNRSPEEREEAFVLEMLVDRLTRMGLFDMKQGQPVRLRWQGREYAAESAVLLLERIAKELMQRSKAP